jgi:hypothetical protein
MNLAELAARLIETAEAEGIEYMIVGAIAAGAYGIPRATKDIDLLISVNTGSGVRGFMRALSDWVEFDAQVMFDAITWGTRHVGRTRSAPPTSVEIFETFEDPFVQAEFKRRCRVLVPMIGRAAWLPTPEDVIVQKLRWGRNKDLDDARDVLAVQGPESLDISYVEKWCAEHDTVERLKKALSEIPPIGGG